MGKKESARDLHQIIYYSGKKLTEKYAPANINFYLSGTFYENYVWWHSNQTFEQEKNASTDFVMKKKTTNDPEAKKYAIAINLPLSFLFLSLALFFFTAKLYLYDLFNCRVLNVKSEEKRFI